MGWPWERSASSTSPGIAGIPCCPGYWGAPVLVTGYAASVLSGVHVSTDHRSVGGPDAAVVAAPAADAAGLYAGSGFHGLLSIWRTSWKPEGAQSDQTRPANGVREFLAQALTMLPAGHRIGLVWADSSFFVAAFLTALEARDLPYIIVARLTPLVRKLVIHRIPEADWQPVTRGIAVVMAMLPAWRGQTHRFVCLWQTLTGRPTASGRRLLECPGYTYRVFVTTVLVAAELVSRMSAGRADCENRIKELKEDLSLDTFCL